MGLLYKAFQGVCYDSMDLAREKGKEVKTEKKKHKRTYWDDDSTIEDFIKEQRRIKNIE